MKKNLCLIYLLLTCQLLFSQSQTVLGKGGLVFHTSLVGTIKYPGLKMGADYLVITKNIDKERKNGSHKLITKNRYLTSNIGLYYHKGYNANIFLQVGYLLERTNAKGWQRSFEPQIGISRTFIDAPVYKVTDAGQVKKIRAAGDFYLAPAFSFGFGKDFSVKHPNNPLKLFTKVTVFMNYPYNNFIYARGIIEAGAAYKFSNLLSHSVKVKNKKR